ncbi:MAG: DUF58 domain-containing protein [Planctomycetaceae bacterium]|jgi:uncharacterized protein (DUF58 family)|nr:DUF58 domain-containing protein [Planctomycetaceae bacterium]
MKNKTKTTISREGVYFLFIIIVVLIGSIVREVNPMLLLAALFCASIPIVRHLGIVSLRGLRVKRRLPTRVFAGEPFVVHIELSNSRTPQDHNQTTPEPNSDSPNKTDSDPHEQNNSDNDNGKNTKTNSSKNAVWGIVVSDKIQPLFGEFDKLNGDKPPVYEPAIYFEYVANHGVVRKTYAGRLPQRGQYKFGPMTISTRFPFGFLRHSTSLREEDDYDEFCVFPKIGYLSPQWRLRRSEVAANRQRYRYRPSRGTGEFLGVRRWMPGDTQRWVHWRASAKHDQPFVRQFETKQNHDCAVLLDIYRNFPVTSPIELENFELAVSFAATLVSDMTRRGGCDLFFATSKTGEDYLSGPICLPLVESVLKRLAITQYDSNDNLYRVIQDVLSQIDPGADIILISPTTLNINESPRFKPFKNDPRFRAALQRIRLVDTSHNDFDKYFSF